jgi:hypothetical protein
LHDVARHRWLSAALIVFALSALPDSARADGWHGGGGGWHGGGWGGWHGGGWHGNCCCCGNRFFFSFGFPAPVFPAVPFYYPPPVFVAPPAVFVPPAAPLVGPPSFGPALSNGCRQYTAPISIGGQIVQSSGTACPQADGSWRIIN